MKTAYLVRWGAYGDHVHMTNVIKALDELGYHITFEYNYKGGQIHAHNPRIDQHIPFDPHFAMKNGEKDALKKLTFRHAQAQQSCDLFVNFTYSLENSLIEPESAPGYFWPLWMRREKNTKTCYYDQSMIWAGLTEEKYMGWTGEVYFAREEHQAILDWIHRHQLEDKFIVLWCLRGSMWQKAIYPIAREICDEWLDRHPNTVIVLTGDEFCKKWEWDHPKVIRKSAVWAYRQMLCLSRYVDLVVTPETGLGIGAGVYGTPKIMLLTAASIKNIVGNDRNDFSLQSPAWCSPCTRAIYNTKCCTLNPETQLPICVDFPREMVLGRMEEVYSHRFPRNWAHPAHAEVFV